MRMSSTEFERPSPEAISKDWDQFTGGAPVFGVLRQYQPEDVDGLAWRDAGGDRSGLVTWCVDGHVAEVVSLHAEPPDAGIGARLIEAAEAELKRRGVTELVVATTNDNARALGFYIGQGFRLVRLHLDAMDRVREAKPQVPLVGAGGVPLRDMWELRKEL